jgi:hypothetical protein
LIEKVPFKPIHGLALTAEAVQEVPERILACCGTEHWQEIARRGEAYSGLDEGLLFFCAGVAPIWHGRWYVWAILSANTTPTRMLWLHRQAIKWLDGMQQGEEFRRLEATARADAPAANRWLRMLGFECEGYLRCYDADGNDHRLYARVALSAK